MAGGPTIEYTPNLYNKGRLYQILEAANYLPVIYNYNVNHLEDYIDDKPLNIYGMLMNPHQLHLGVHFGMFAKYIELMGTEEQKKLYYDKAFRC